MSTFVNKINLAKDIVFVDGMWGSGKSILGPLISCFRRAEKWRMEHIYEYLCILKYYHNIDSGACRSLLRIHADLALFNTMISREVNFRPMDESGLFVNNAKAFQYLRRLFTFPGDNIIEEIDKKNPILHIMSHHILQVCPPLFDAFGKSLKLFVMVRHPLYRIDHWYAYIDRIGTNRREFTLQVTYKDKIVPWFCKGWEEEYLSQRCRMDRVVLAIDKITQANESTIQSLSDENKKQVFEIPFEHLVKNPWPYIQQLAVVLNDRPTWELKRMLKRQKVPRKHVSAGRGMESYGWSTKVMNMSEEEDVQTRIHKIKAEASPHQFERLMHLVQHYERKYDTATLLPKST